MYLVQSGISTQVDILYMCSVHSVISMQVAILYMYSSRNRVKKMCKIQVGDKKRFKFKF